MAIKKNKSAKKPAASKPTTSFLNKKVPNLGLWAIFILSLITIVVIIATFSTTNLDTRSQAASYIPHQGKSCYTFQEAARDGMGCPPGDRARWEQACTQGGGAVRNVKEDINLPGSRGTKTICKEGGDRVPCPSYIKSGCQICKECINPETGAVKSKLCPAKIRTN